VAVRRELGCPPVLVPVGPLFDVKKAGDEPSSSTAERFLEKMKELGEVGRNNQLLQGISRYESDH
jgi:hypothetical protein